MNILKRTIQSDILEWIEKPNRTLSLMINGVRRCGKTRNITYVLNEHRANNWIGFDLTKPEDLDFLKIATEGGVEEFIQHVTIKADIKLDNETIFFIDEIQQNEQIYFFIKRYHDYISRKGMQNNIIISGSYIDSTIFNNNYKSLTGTTHKVSMYPLSFYEFVNNLKNGEQLISLTRNKISKKQPVDSITHNTMLGYLNDYMKVGGFPLNVIKYLEKGLDGINDINEYSKSLIDGQKQDITYGVSPKNALKLQDAYNAIKYGFDNKGDKISKFMFKHLKADPSRYKGSGELNIDILSRSQVVLPVIRTLGNECQEDPKKNYKLLYCDMAILNNMVDINYDEGNNKGWIGEHFVGLELMKYGFGPLKYWYKNKPNTNKPGYEIDYIVNNTFPIEVKNTYKSFRTKSLKVYDHSSKPIVISLKNYGDESSEYINIPMYATWMLSELTNG